MATPREDGFRMPPEWAPHARCWMAWPEKRSVWGERVKEAQQAYMEVATAIAEFEPVTVVARPESMAQASLMSSKGVSIRPLEHDDAWTRDTGPTFVTAADGRVAGIDWGFDGYGQKYGGAEVDAGLAERILDHLSLPRYPASLIFEGGAVHVDGDATGLVCAGSALDPNRNPGVTRERVETVLRNALGIDHLIWLEHGLVDDETGGHVDNLACFVRPGVVLTLVGRDKDDPDFAGLQDNLARLRGATDARGRTLEVIELPQPPVRKREARRLTRSYVNFYLPNGGVVLPVFEEATDDAAIRVLRQAFPDRDVVPVVANDIVWGGGGIHCITQQQPAPPQPAGDPA